MLLQTSEAAMTIVKVLKQVFFNPRESIELSLNFFNQARGKSAKSHQGQAALHILKTRRIPAGYQGDGIENCFASIGGEIR